MKSDGLTWAVFFARVVLGLTFLMAGYWKVFDLTPAQHAQGFFVEGYAESWIPVWLLWTLGVSIPVVELVAGALVCVGFRRLESLVALGVVLVIVTYGHLLSEPLFSISGHILPRLVLLVFVLVVPRERDVITVDRLLARGRS